MMNIVSIKVRQGPPLLGVLEHGITAAAVAQTSVIAISTVEAYV